MTTSTAVASGAAVPPAQDPRPRGALELLAAAALGERVELVAAAGLQLRVVRGAAVGVEAHEPLDDRVLREHAPDRAGAVDLHRTAGDLRRDRREPPLVAGAVHVVERPPADHEDEHGGGGQLDRQGRRRVALHPTGIGMIASRRVRDRFEGPELAERGDCRLPAAVEQPRASGRAYAVRRAAAADRGGPAAWCPEWDGELRVSSLRPACSRPGRQPPGQQSAFHADAVVRAAQLERAVLPQHGRIESRRRAIELRDEVALRMIGFEDEPGRGSICSSTTRPRPRSRPRADRPASTVRRPGAAQGGRRRSWPSTCASRSSTPPTGRPSTSRLGRRRARQDRRQSPRPSAQAADGDRASGRIPRHV